MPFYGRDLPRKLAKVFVFVKSRELIWRDHVSNICWHFHYLIVYHKECLVWDWPHMERFSGPVLIRGAYPQE